MSREIYQKYGFIIALVIAGISLPTSIIALTREPNIINNNYCNTFVNTVKTEPHNLANGNFEAVVFNCSKGDKIIAVWSTNVPNYIDVFFMNKENFELFNDGLSFTAVLSEMNSSSGFFEYEIIIPNLYFAVFRNLVISSVWLNYQVTQYHFDTT